MSDDNKTTTRSIQRAADAFYNNKRYQPYMDILEHKSLVGKMREITSFDFYALGKQLEAFDDYRQITEEDGTVSQLGKVPDIAFDVITTVYGTSPISAIASVQPIAEEKGLVYYRTVVAQTTRGNVTAGDRITNAYAPPDVAPVGFSGDTTTTNAVATVAGTTTYTVLLPNAPVKPGSVRLAVSGLTAPNFDDSHGNILGKGIQGTINYTTGTAQVVFSSDPGNGHGITAVYATDFEAAPDIPKIISKMDTKNVQARVFALKSTVGLEQAYALRRRFGMVAEDEIAADLTAAINSEIVNTMVVQLAASAVGVTNWKKTAPAEFSYAEYKQTFFDALTTADSEMLANAGRGTINTLIAGRSAAALLSTLPQFTKISDGANFGPHIFGTLNGMTVVRVPDSRILDSDTVLALYAGTSPFDAAAVYAPYMPLVITSAMPNGVNPLLNQKAAAIWAAVDVLVPSFVTKIVFVA